MLLVGGGGREDAIARNIVRDGGELYVVMKNRNPSIVNKSREFLIADELDYERIVEYAMEHKIDIAFVSPDPVLNTPLVDTLKKKGFPVASPSHSSARIETSKKYMRDLFERNNIEGNLFYKSFTSEDDYCEFLRLSDDEFAIKPLGLTGGKGVKVMGEHLANKDEAIEYGRSIIRKDGEVLIEKKMKGEEFSLQVFSDGKDISPMPIVQDYKRAYEGDKGPNTGGMGSITDSNGILPFISKKTADSATEILGRVIKAMNQEDTPFKGVMYGQFIQTPEGPKVIEINSRFGDPEGINVMSLLEDNFVDLLYKIHEGKITGKTKFRPKATVLKYVVPTGYGSNPLPGTLTIDSNPEYEQFKIYYAAVSGTLRKVEMSTSRSLALVGISDTITEASDIVEENLSKIHGDYYIRHDIGTKEFIQQKMAGFIQS